MHRHASKTDRRANTDKTHNMSIETENEMSFNYWSLVTTSSFYRLTTYETRNKTAHNQVISSYTSQYVHVCIYNMHPSCSPFPSLAYNSRCYLFQRYCCCHCLSCLFISSFFCLPLFLGIYICDDNKMQCHKQPKY